MKLDELKLALSTSKASSVTLTYRGYDEAFPPNAASEHPLDRAARLAEQYGFRLENRPKEQRVIFKRKI